LVATVFDARAKPFPIAAILAVGTFLFVLGGYSAAHDLWPWTWLRQLNAALRGPVAPSSPREFTFGSFGRLTAKPQSEAVDCPRQDAHTAVLLIAGQSNAANFGGQPTVSAHGARIVNFHSGRCYVAGSPLLGSTGTWGEYWTETANLLVSFGHFERIVLVPAAIGGTSIARWSAGADLNRMLLHTAAGVAAAGLTITHVLWHQGEEDAGRGMRESDYRAHFDSLVKSLRGIGVTAPVYVSVATKCLLLGPYSENKPVARAQAKLPSVEAGVRAGVDSDRLLADTDRFDGCHLSGSGTFKMARAWAELLGVAR
jgi:carbohydrate esterase-like sialic acid-specific acetylesterase